VGATDEVSMRVAGTMIGAAGDYTISAVVQRDDAGRFSALARVSIIPTRRYRSRPGLPRDTW
jgi:hypothetical protein